MKEKLSKFDRYTEKMKSLKFVSFRTWVHADDYAELKAHSDKLRNKRLKANEKNK